LPAPIFFALRSFGRREVFGSSSALRMTQMLMHWSSLEGDAILLRGFSDQDAAAGWVEAPVLPLWVQHACRVAGIGEGDTSAPSHHAAGRLVFGLVTRDGAYLAREDAAVDVPCLINTLCELQGGCAVGRVFESVVRGRA